MDRDPWKEHGTRDRGPLEETWDQAVRQEVISYWDLLSDQNDWHMLLNTLPYPKLRLRTVKMNNSMGYFLDFQIQMELNARVTWPFSATHSQVLLVWLLSMTCVFTCRQTIGSTFWITWFVRSLLKLPAGHLHKSEYFLFTFATIPRRLYLQHLSWVFPKCPHWIQWKNILYI